VIFRSLMHPLRNEVHPFDSVMGHVATGLHLLTILDKSLFCTVKNTPDIVLRLSKQSCCPQIFKAPQCCQMFRAEVPAKDLRRKLRSSSRVPKYN
jgi:hypothetical protein